MQRKKWIGHSGPGICALFQIEKGEIAHIGLALSESFEWEVAFHEKDALLEEKIAAWMAAYSQRKNGTILLPLKKTFFPSFTEKCLSFVSQIPFGESLSYGECAQKMGSSGAARAVGSACGRNPYALVVPCHRVLAAKSSLGGFSYPIEIKRRLIAFEQLA